MAAPMTDPRAMNAPTGFHDDRPLRREDLVDGPDRSSSGRWLADAEAAGIPLPNAMARGDGGRAGPARRSATCCCAASTSAASRSSRTTRAARAASSTRTRTRPWCSCGRAGPPGERDRHRRARRRRRSPTRTSPRGRARPGSARGRPPRAACSRAGSELDARWPQTARAVRGRATCRGRPTGAGSWFAPRPWSSGRAGDRGCTTGSGTRATGDRLAASTGSPRRRPCRRRAGCRVGLMDTDDASHPRSRPRCRAPSPTSRRSFGSPRSATPATTRRRSAPPRRRPPASCGRRVCEDVRLIELGRRCRPPGGVRRAARARRPRRRRCCTRTTTCSPKGPAAEWTSPPFEPSRPRRPAVRPRRRRRQVRHRDPRRRAAGDRGRRSASASRCWWRGWRSAAPSSCPSSCRATRTCCGPTSPSWPTAATTGPAFPTIGTSVRGVTDCVVEVSVLPRAQHSGSYGGPIPDAITALARMIASPARRRRRRRDRRAPPVHVGGHADPGGRVPGGVGRVRLGADDRDGPAQRPAALAAGRGRAGDRCARAWSSPRTSSCRRPARG